MVETPAERSNLRVHEFASFYAAHSGRVLAYALRRAPRHDAEEIVAEVFLTAWRRPDAVPDSDPVPWLLATARNHLRNRQRSDRRRTQLGIRMTANSSSGDHGGGAMVDPAERFDEQVIAFGALESMPEALREAVLLVAWDGLDRGAAARVLGCSLAALAVRLHRARRFLESALDQSPDHAISLPPPSSNRFPGGNT